MTMEQTPDAAPHVVIRPFELNDREAVRRICVDTADGGAPLDVELFPDPELFADLLTQYYTDYNPAMLWVADAGGEVVGYLSGCLDTLAMQRVSMRKVVPASLWRSIWRGTWCRLGTWRTLWNNAWVWTESLLQRQRHVQRYPAQLHVNLKPGFRGHQVGRRLVEHFLGQARENRVGGVEASVREDNVKARRFFETLGFVALGRLPLLVRGGRMLSSVIYGKTV